MRGSLPQVVVTLGLGEQRQQVLLDSLLHRIGNHFCKRIVGLLVCLHGSCSPDVDGGLLPQLAWYFAELSESQGDLARSFLLHYSFLCEFKLDLFKAGKHVDVDSDAEEKSDRFNERLCQ